MTPLHDFRLACRALVQPRNRGFTLASMLTLALGIAAATAMYSVIAAVLLAPLPYRDADRVVRIFEANDARGLPDFAVSTPNYASWRERADTFDAMAALAATSVNLGGDGATPAERVSAFSATANVWDVLGLPLVRGRTFTATEDAPNGAAVAIIGEGLWQRRFGARDDVIGRTLRVQGEDRTIVGVAPGDVGFANDIDVWLPLAAAVDERRRGDRRLEVLARLAPGVTLAQAQARMDEIAAALAAEFPRTNEGWRARLMTAQAWIVDQSLRQRLMLLFVAVLAVLLVACLNVANLQLARAATRTRENGVRKALGATRGRVIAQAAMESLALAIPGGVLGLVLASLAIAVVAPFLPAASPRMASLAIDWPVALFALGTTFATALVFGIAPAIAAARTDAAVALQQAGRTGTDARAAPLRQALVVAQFALATVLVVGAALLLQHFARLQDTPLGFRPDNVLIARLSPVQADDDERDHARSTALYRQLADGIRALPGVTSVGLTSEVPMGPVNTAMSVSQYVVGAPDIEASWRIVSGDYFASMGIAVLRGRTFATEDEPPTSMLVSAGLARRLWPDGSDVVGREVILGNGQRRTIIGIVGDVRQVDVAADDTPTMYFAPTWYLWPTMTLTVRTERDPAALIAPIRALALSLSPQEPLYDLQTMDAVIGANIAGPRLQTTVLAVFAVLGLLLAALGVAGVMAFVVARRTPELAVRLALGATPRRVVAHVMRGGGAMCIAGIVIGLVASLALARFLRGVIDAAPVDIASTIAIVAVILGIVGLVACWVPARRATRIAPSLALRGD